MREGWVSVIVFLAVFAHFSGLTPWSQTITLRYEVCSREVAPSSPDYIGAPKTLGIDGCRAVSGVAPRLRVFADSQKVVQYTEIGPRGLDGCVVWDVNNWRCRGALAFPDLEADHTSVTVVDGQQLIAREGGDFRVTHASWFGWHRTRLLSGTVPFSDVHDALYSAF